VSESAKVVLGSEWDRERRWREKLHAALRDILLVESGRTIRHNMTDEEMWQAMTDIARAALEADRG
jgi:hypothetical protein